MPEVSHAVAWLVVVVLIEAAIIDGLKLKVPNWLTYHFLAGGLVYSAWTGGGPMLAWSVAGAATGLLTLLPLYAIGGMGAGDVKLMAGMGAWIGPWCTIWAFAATAVTGAAMALVMMALSGAIFHHIGMMQTIGREILAIKNPAILAERAAERKPTMTLLPYGIPIAVGSIGYLAFAGLLFF
jgi:prepilin peptidase CpaA